MDGTTRLSRYFTPRAQRTTTFVLNQSDPLEMMQGHLSNMADGLERLQDNVHNLLQLQTALLEFNAAFSAFIKGMELNATCIEWSENPGAVSFERARRRAQHMQVASPPPAPPSPHMDAMHEPATAAAAAAPKTRVPVCRPGKKGILKKPVFPVDRIVSTLPAKYNQPPHYGLLELILRKLHETPEGMYLYDIVKLSGCPRGRCTEYMNALVSAKVVTKSSKKGILYQLDATRHY